MNKRMVSIIQQLSNLEKKICIADLAAKYEVSQRTVRNDINAINDILKDHKLIELKLEKGGKIIRDSGFHEILQYIDDKDFYDYKLLKEERKKIAAVLLINSSGFITLLDIAEHMSVSRATVISDLDEIKEYIRKGNLRVISHANKGLRVEGKESDKRIFLMKLVSFNPESEEQDVVGKQIAIDYGIKDVLGKILYEQEHVYESFLSDHSFQKILAYLIIMTNRIQQGEYVETREKKKNSKYEMAESILKYVGQYCHMIVTDDEVLFLSELLSSGRYIKQKKSDKDPFRIQMVTRLFIEQISEELGINLNRDYDFFESLSNHMESVFSEAPVDYEKNHVIEKVLEENAEIMQAVSKKVSVIREYAGRDITADEIGYITIHVCAAIERKKNKEISFHVIVACHAGIGTSRFLLEKLKKHFNFQIIDIVSSHEAKNLTLEQADFVISTVPLKECKIPYIIVSPLLSDADYLTIGNMIDKLRNTRNLPSREHEKKKTAKELMGKMIPVLYDKVPEEAGELARQLGEIVSEFFRESPDFNDELYSPYLYQLLPASHIQVDIQCNSWQEAVRESAKKLLDLGYIEERYVDAMIRNIEENGPYIVLSKGFAFPHEGVDQGTRRLGMNLIRLASPINFDAEERDPVEFVCCLSATDNKTHLKAFFNLVNLLKREEFKEELRKCQTSEAMAEVIERYERIILSE